MNSIKWLCRAIGWIWLGLLINSWIPYDNSDLGWVDTGPSTYWQVVGRAAVWFSLGAILSMFGWAAGQIHGNSTNGWSGGEL